MRIFKDTASKLQQAHDDVAACESAILAAQQERLQKLPDAEPDELIRLDRAVDDRQRQKQIFVDRIAALESKLAVETADRRKADYQAHVAKIEKQLADRDRAAIAVEAAVRQLVQAAIAFKDVSARVGAWPADVPAPPFYSGFHSASGLGELVRGCFVVPPRPYSPTPPTAREFAERLYTAADRCAGFAESLRKSDQAIIADLKDPSPQSDEAAA